MDLEQLSVCLMEPQEDPQGITFPYILDGLRIFLKYLQLNSGLFPSPLEGCLPTLFNVRMNPANGFE